MKMTVKHFFDAAHQLVDSDELLTKGCARLHGHTYAVIVDFDGKPTKSGMIVDFKAIKNIIDELDHQFINDIFKAKGLNHQPTAENIAMYLAGQLVAQLHFSNITVSVCEGYKGVERSSWVSFNTSEA